MNKIKAILFDMDGVLIEAKEWHYESLNKALKLFGMEITRHDHLVTYDGLPTLRKLEMLSLERGLPRGLHEFINDIKQQYTLEIVHLNCKPTFHHEYALSKLKSLGYRMAVCSNSIRDTVEIMMQKSALDRYLDFYISNQDVENGKPDPEMYDKAIKKMDLEPGDCLIIEDNENGKKAAYGSGAWVMEVEQVNEVNFQSIMDFINNIENSNEMQIL